METKLIEKIRPILTKAKLPNQSAGRRSQVDSGGLLATFLLPMAMEEDKAQGKEGEDEGVFLRFGDDLAADDNLRLIAAGKPRVSKSKTIESSRMEVADGFVDDAGTAPTGRCPGGIGQSGPRDAECPNHPE